ncbi:DNA/RNA non-specific endonuclease [Lacticaseibacillus sp. GG6-2]
MKKLIALIVVSAAVLTGCGAQHTASDAQVSSLSSATKTNHSIKHTLEQTESKNRKTAATISSLKSRLSADQHAASIAQKQTPKVAASSKAPAQPAATTDLAAKNYAGQQEIVINQNNPGFSASDLSTAHSAWERYSDLDSQNRAVDAQALLNQSLMPSAKREPLTWDPTGWHNRRTAHGWLYNRSHLIGFQLSGENNNPKNLITGTMSLNNPLMLAHEMDIATYLKASSSHYVRYEVRPVYRGSELVARGVQMRAQSIGDNNIHFNVYIFNVEDGYTIDYATGTSTTN